MRPALLAAALVGAGGFVGSILRYAVSGWVQQRFPSSTFPWGTLSVNALGCLAIGVIAGLAESRQWLGPELRVLLLVGVLGGFTTFSTFGWETVGLLRDGELVRALGNVSANVLIGLGLVWIGYALFTSN